MIDPVWLGAASLVVGTGGVSTAILAFRRAKPEAKKMNADTAAVIATTAGKWVSEADDRMEEMAAQLRTILANQRRQDEMIAIHVRWDRQVLAALEEAKINHLPEPPPIYLPQTG